MQMSTEQQQRVQSYQDLEVWQVGMDLVAQIYRISAELPSEERFGLVAQVRRAAVSVPANVAEGYGRQSTRDFVRFLRMAQGSLKEAETHLLVAVRLEMLNAEQTDSALRLSDRLGRMIRGLIRSLEDRP
ncbi:MAG: four helix bundle protein [Phycisphaerales bacterium JB059]